jgi:glutamate-ammonia-ligase adenylyltransferase
VVRIETTQGTLARRGFADASAAERIVAEWEAEREPVLELLTRSADPDLALAGLDRLTERVPDLTDRLTANPVLARQLIMVLGASAKLTQHLLAHPEHLDLLDAELTKARAAELRATMLGATGADPDSQVPVATELTGDDLRIA